MNPAPYTTVTFPFLFAVMFGDIGHGVILSIFAIFIFFKEKRSATESELWMLISNGRYIILLMGLFSIYTGLIYNDVFSKTVNIFGSGWRINFNSTTIMGMSNSSGLQLDPVTDFNRTYPFGLDPAWQVASINKILFQNSYKMKLSIIMGVLHMTFGIFVGIFNTKCTKIFLHLIPQVIFMSSLFLYTVILMFIKWIKYSAKNPDQWSEHCAPSVLITFINMVLFKKSKAGKYCETPFMFAGQDVLQKLLVVLAIICIPWMMFAGPIMVLLERRRGRIPLENAENEKLSEILINHAIHTIEFVLGTISHTASYLRLWALSLAHSRKFEIFCLFFFEFMDD